MKIKWGSLVVDGRNKIGGHVASKNRSGAYLRTKVTPVNPATSDQQFVRNNFTANTQAWKGLTAAQRLQFNSAVADFSRTDIFGDLRILSGFNLFCALNNNLRFIGESPITAPPVPAAVPAFATFSAAVDVTAGTVTLTFTPAIAATEVVIVRATQGLSAGVYFVKSELRKYDLLTDADTSPHENSTEYEAKFGSISAAGTKVFFTMQNIVKASGLPGAITKASAIVTS